MRRVLPLIGGLLIMPQMAAAQILITEFVYDAQGTDDKQEWVELYNNGGVAIDLTKWKINDGSNHVLNVPPKNGGVGSIVIPSHAYVILADDAPTFIAANPSAANVIDTTLALPNTSGTLALINESGSTEDSVTYAKAQGAAGDGNSLQWDGSAYVAAAATPGAVFSGTPAASQTETQTDTQTQTQTQTQTSAPQPQAAVSSYVAPVTPQIYAYAGKDRDVIAGADAIFQGAAYDRKGDAISDQDKVRFLWSFGDGGSGAGASVTHRFAQPGRYAVVLDIAQAISAASAQVVVTAHPVSIDVTVDNGSIVLTNKSGRDLDLSGWQLRSGVSQFTLPQHTVLLKGAAVPFSPEVTRLAASGDASLLYPNGVVAAGLGAVAHEALKTQIPDAAVPAEAAKTKEDTQYRVADQQSAPIRAIDKASEGESDETPPSETATATAQVAAAGESAPVNYGWWGGAGVLALSAAAAAVAARRVKKTEWDIEEMPEG